jgi:hypothetical protein
MAAIHPFPSVARDNEQLTHIEAADRNFEAGDRAGDDQRVGEHGMSARLPQARPIRQHCKPIAEMADGVDADVGVERPAAKESGWLASIMLKVAR